MSMDRRSRAAIRKLGQAIATGGLEPGTWVLCEARQTSQDRGQELWLGRTVSLQFESLQEGLGLTQWTWKRRRMALETTTALVLSVVWWWWRLGTAEITGRSAPFPLSSLLKSLAHPLVLYFFSFVRSTKLATRFPTRHHTLKMASAGRGCDKTVFFDHPAPRFA